MRIAIIGAGEVGRTYALAASQIPGFEVVLNDPRPPAEGRALAKERGLDLHESAGAWLSTADRVWVCVTGDIAHKVTAGVLPHLRTGALLVDLSTATPEHKRESARAAQSADVRYVDAVIMGAVGLSGVRTPLLASGPDAEEALADFARLEAPVRALPEAGPGDATALKLLRTVLTKGLEALAVECLTAAEKMGVRTELYDVLADVDESGLTAFMNAVVRTHVLHAERRMHEITRAAAQLEELGLPSLLLPASEERFARTAKALTEAPPAAGTADSVDTAIAWLLSVAAKDAARP
jgi:3-hydroxyisobutyrate dehydrogenase